MDLFDGPDDFLDGGGAEDAVPADIQPLLDQLQHESKTERTAAVSSIHEAGLAALQDRVCAALHEQSNAKDAAFVDAVLAYLDEHGDGRCVRPMEEALVANGPLMTERQAWRARHIVQKIRRFGRK